MVHKLSRIFGVGGFIDQLNPGVETLRGLAGGYHKERDTC